jgi:hypothetical protein
MMKALLHIGPLLKTVTFACASVSSSGTSCEHFKRLYFQFFLLIVYSGKRHVSTMLE